ncbi:MAG: EAL domain-containing protein [Woeseiaceae bacterium]
MNDLTNIKYSQARMLFSFSQTANIAILALGILIFTALHYFDNTSYAIWFLIVLIVLLSARHVISQAGLKIEHKHLIRYANYYVLVSFAIGLDFALLNVLYSSTGIHNLTILLTIISFGLITAAIGSLSIWINAYLAFSAPQLIALIYVYTINDSIFVAFAIVIYSAFMLKIANNFNLKYKEGRLLINENIHLISNMEQEIRQRINVQNQLEQYQTELEDKVNIRTRDLEIINDNLYSQIERRSKVEKQLEFLAYYDELTGLPNRNLFIDNVKNSIERAKRNNCLLSVLFIDLDRFKNINDSHGHLVGDKLLLEVATRLRSLLRNSDVVARNGGDEFSCLIQDMKSVTEPFNVANKIIKSLNQPFIVDGHSLHIGCSIGVSLYPLDADNEINLIEMADIAMYEVKKAGRNNFQFYSASMSHQINNRIILETALHTALENNEFFIMYQPQVDLHTKRTTGFEALIRWRNPELGLISPVTFIPILEETGLIYSVGEWIIREVIQFIKDSKFTDEKVSINLSALQCSEHNLSKKIKSIIVDSGIKPSLVGFEITESLLIDDFSKTQMFLTDLSNIGCSIALDDFGTGFTSFGYLIKLPIDTIKIDRSFITDIHNNNDLQNIVKAIVTMCESLGLQNIFEGVENSKELDIVKNLNGSIIQGYFYSKPLAANKVSSWLETPILEQSVESS